MPANCCLANKIAVDSRPVFDYIGLTFPRGAGAGETEVVGLLNLCVPQEVPQPCAFCQNLLWLSLH